MSHSTLRSKRPKTERDASYSMDITAKRPSPYSTVPTKSNKADVTLIYKAVTHPVTLGVIVASIALGGLTYYYGMGPSADMFRQLVMNLKTKVGSFFPDKKEWDNWYSTHISNSILADQGIAQWALLKASQLALLIANTIKKIIDKLWSIFDDIRQLGEQWRNHDVKLNLAEYNNARLLKEVNSQGEEINRLINILQTCAGSLTGETKLTAEQRNNIAQQIGELTPRVRVDPVAELDADKAFLNNHENNQGFVTVVNRDGFTVLQPTRDHQGDVIMRPVEQYPQSSNNNMTAENRLQEPIGPMSSKTAARTPDEVIPLHQPGGDAKQVNPVVRRSNDAMEIADDDHHQIVTKQAPPSAPQEISIDQVHKLAQGTVDRINDLTTQLNRLQGELAEKHATLASNYRTTSQTLGNSLAENNSIVATLQRNMDQNFQILNDKYANVSSILDDTQKNMLAVDQRDRMNTLEQRVINTESNLAEQQQSISKHTETINGLIQAGTRLEGQVTNLNAAQQQNQTQIQTLDSKFTEATDQLSKTLKAQSDEIKSAHEAISKLKTQYRTVKNDVDTFSKQLLQINNNITEIVSSYTNSFQTEMRKRMDEFQSSSNEKITKTIEQFQQHKNEVYTTVSTNTVAYAKIAGLQEELDSKIENQRKRIANYDAQLTAATNLGRSNETTISLLKDQIDSAKVDIRKTTSEITKSLEQSWGARLNSAVEVLETKNTQQLALINKTFTDINNEILNTQSVTERELQASKLAADAFRVNLENHVTQTITPLQEKVMHLENGVNNSNYLALEANNSANAAKSNVGELANYVQTAGEQIQNSLQNYDRELAANNYQNQQQAASNSALQTQVTTDIDRIDQIIKNKGLTGVEADLVKLMTYQHRNLNSQDTFQGLMGTAANLYQLEHDEFLKAQAAGQTDKMQMHMNTLQDIKNTVQSRQWSADASQNALLKDALVNIVARDLNLNPLKKVEFVQYANTLDPQMNAQPEVLIDSIIQRIETSRDRALGQQDYGNRFVIPISSTVTNSQQQVDHASYVTPAIDYVAENSYQSTNPQSGNILPLMAPGTPNEPGALVPVNYSNALGMNYMSDLNLFDANGNYKGLGLFQQKNIPTNNTTGFPLTTKIEIQEKKPKRYFTFT